MTENFTGSENVAGLSVSAEAFHAVLIDGSGNIVKSANLRLRAEEEIGDHILDFVQALKVDFGPFDQIGIAVPGLVLRETGYVEYSTQFPGEWPSDLIDRINNETGIKAYVENDGNAAAYAEFMIGSGRRVRNMFYFTLGVGVGGALILDGELWRGTNGFAGEVGYLPVDQEGLRLEDVASSPSIVRRTLNRFKQDSTSVLAKLEPDDITIAAIIDAAEKEDDLALLMLERTGNYVGSAVAGVINLLDVEKIVIGGDIMRVGSVVLDAIVARATELAFSRSFERTEIVAGELGDPAAAIGVAMLAAGR